MSDYPAFNKIPRLHRDVILTEKIDGTNGLIQILPPGTWTELMADPSITAVPTADGFYAIRAGSRNRWLTVENDNFGFARWVRDNAVDLLELGAGRHYGEWFGRKIQHGYGLSVRKFALFNVSLWYDQHDEIQVQRHATARAFDPKWFSRPVPSLEDDSLTVVPLLGVVEGYELNNGVLWCLDFLEAHGSLAVKGAKAEGVIAYHTASNQLFKALIEGDDVAKSAALQAAA